MWQNANNITIIQFDCVALCTNTQTYHSRLLLKTLYQPLPTSQCRHSNWNRFLPPYLQTYTHPPQLLSQRAHCFGHSWPLCFTYQSLSEACWAPLSSTSPVLFQTAGQSHPYLCFRRLLWLLPLIFDLRVTQNLAKALVLPAHGCLFCLTHRKTAFCMLVTDYNFKSYQLRLHGLHTSWNIQTFISCILLNRTWEEKAQTKVLATISSFCIGS